MSLHDYTIRKLNKNDIYALKDFPPSEWNFDMVEFLKNYLGEKYYHAVVLTYNNIIIGTGSVFINDNSGWLANIIVKEDFRNKGLGTKITKYLIDYLKNINCKTQILIATEQGEGIYEKLGFQKVSEYVNFETNKDIELPKDNDIRKITPNDLNNIIDLDTKTNDEKRSHFIRKFYHDGLISKNDKNELTGFYLPNFGRGLIVSTQLDTGISFLNIKHRKKGERSLIPIENHYGISYMEKIGLKRGYKCSRMILGEPKNWKPENIYSYGSGYFG